MGGSFSLKDTLTHRNRIDFACENVHELNLMMMLHYPDVPSWRRLQWGCERLHMAGFPGLLQPGISLRTWGARSAGSATEVALVDFFFFCLSKIRYERQCDSDINMWNSRHRVMHGDGFSLWYDTADAVFLSSFQLISSSSLATVYSKSVSGCITHREESFACWLGLHCAGALDRS